MSLNNMLDQARENSSTMAKIIKDLKCCHIYPYECTACGIRHGSEEEAALCCDESMVHHGPVGAREVV